MDNANSSTLSIERSIYIGNVFGAILYGLLIYMVFQSWYYMKGRKTETSKRKAFYIYYGFIQLFLVTVELATNQVASQFMWIDHRNFPGGSFAYYLAIGNSWFEIWNIVCGVISSAVNDGLLLYRCYIIWNSNWRIIALPSLLYIAELSIGVFVPIETAIPDTTFFSTKSTNFSIPWISLACALNAILTLLIIGRILHVSRKTQTFSNYTGVVAILVESMVPFSLIGIAFAICVGKNYLPSIPLADIWGVLVAMSSQLIILRVSMGCAWTEETGSLLTRNLEFDHQKTTGETSDVSHITGNESTPESNTIV